MQPTLLRTACLLACALPLVAAQAQTTERQTIDSLRATTQALLDELERQGQAARERADQAARQAAEQQRASTAALLDLLVSQGLLPRERADGLLRQLQASQPTPAAAAAATPNTEAARAAAPAPAWGDAPRGAQAAAAAGAGQVVRVPYVSETLKSQLRNEIRNDVLAVARDERWADPRLLPDWVRGVTVHGDVRVRAQHEHLPDTNAPAFDYRAQAGAVAWSPDLLNTQTDRDRLTLRARLAVDAKVSDDIGLGLRLSTGSTSGPASASQTLGTGFNKASVVLDRAFLRYEPVQDLRVLAGRMANPFFGSDLLWADDLGFDGVAVQGERNLASGAYAFATAGAFPLEEFSVDRRDKWLYAAQLGVDWSFGGNLQWRTGLAVYDFANVAGVRETSLPPSGAKAGTVPYFSSQYPVALRQKGNTLINLVAAGDTSTAATWGLASKFRPVNLTSVLTLRQFAPVEVALGLDYVKNSAFDLNDISQRAGVALDEVLKARTSGLQARASVGRPALADKGDWLLIGALRRFERDAWIDGFTDTTWHLGGTGYRGFSLHGQYAFDRRATVGLRLTSSRALDDGVRSPTGETTRSSGPLRIDVLQFDMSARF